MTTSLILDHQFTYQVDCNDAVVFLDTAWLRFARANGAPELDTTELIGKPLWAFIADPETIELYHMLMAKARHTAQPVGVNFRCDAPSCRRMMRLEIAPCEDGGLIFTSLLVEEQPRPYQLLLNPSVPHSGEFLSMCSWCKQVHVDQIGWIEVEDAIDTLGLFDQPVLPQISHGICERCYEDVMAVLD